MRKAEINAFRRALDSQQTELSNGSRNHEALASETSPDELDRIQYADDHDYAMGDLERNSGRLREVLTALRLIHAGTLGICVGCEENITPKRLAAVVWASFCVVCYEAAERERQTPRSEFDTSLAMVAQKVL